jgi:hypothetical protein
VGPPSDFIKNKVLRNHRVIGRKEIWCSDASADGYCAYTVAGDKDFFCKGKFLSHERQHSSGLRELLAVRHALANWKEKFPEECQSRTIYWLTDSENLVIFLQKGSTKAHVQAEVLAVLQQARQLQLQLIPVHLRREDPRIRIADAGSKAPDSDNWGIDQDSFQSLASRHGPFTIDLFSDAANKKLSRFYSNFYSAEAAGLDAFTQDWTGEKCWACPPVKLLIRTIRKLRATDCSGVLIAPEWRTGKFWPFIFAHDGSLLRPFKSVSRFRPYIFQFENAKSALRGVPRFDLLALQF